jgi:hypothetical protein
MKYWKLSGVFLAAATLCSQSARPQQQQSQDPKQVQPAAQTVTKIPAGSKVFVAAMGGFETPLKKAIADKKVPLQIVEQREEAEYEITGTADSKKASTAKKVILGSWHSDEDASIKVANLKSGEIVYAYAVHKQDSAHGQKSTAEACAKHLKDEAIIATK